jgi:hypothetical protein
MRTASHKVQERDNWLCYRVLLNEDCFTQSSGERQLVVLQSTAE